MKAQETWRPRGALCLYALLSSVSALAQSIWVSQVREKLCGGRPAPAQLRRSRRADLLHVVAYSVRPFTTSGATRFGVPLCLAGFNHRAVRAGDDHHHRNDEEVVRRLDADDVTRLASLVDEVEQSCRILVFANESNGRCLSDWPQGRADIKSSTG